MILQIKSYKDIKQNLDDACKRYFITRAQSEYFTKTDFKETRHFLYDYLGGCTTIDKITEQLLDFIDLPEWLYNKHLIRNKIRNIAEELAEQVFIKIST